MRIIYIHQYFKTLSSSSSTRSYEAARQLAARGHDVHIVTSSGEATTKTTQILENFTVHWIPVSYSQYMSYKDRMRAFLSFALRSAKVSYDLCGDIVFATSTPLTVAIPGIAATIFRKSPLVFEVRDLWPDIPIVMGALKNPLAKFLGRALEAITYRYSAHIVALSPDMKKAITAKGVPEEKVSVIPNASDNDLFRRRGAPASSIRHQYSWLGDRKLVLYCGTLGLVNDVSYIARLAAQTIKIDDSIRFLVVGEGNDEDNVRKTAKNLGVYDKNFFMMPPVPKTQVPDIFATADVSMSTVAPLPLLSANSANKVFDSFASGTPLAINHEGWLADLLRETGAGLILDSSDLRQASNDLIAFLNASSALEESSHEAKKMALTKFDRQKITNQLAELLEQAQDNKGKYMALRKTV